MTTQQSRSQQNISDRRQSLETAFNLFNQLSDELSGSYRQLQLQVLELSQELAATRSERMLQLTEKENLADRLERLLETLPAAVILLDGKGRIREFNPAATRLLGCIVMGDDWQQILSPQLLPNQPSGNELHLRNGKVLSVSSSQLEQTPGVIQVMLDVTESRRLQERLNRQERLGAMGEMSAQLAHQMRTPLSSALLYTSHLFNDQLSREQRQDFTGKLRTRLQHMERQISDILLFARGQNVADKPLCLSELVTEFAETIASELLQSHASLEVTMSTHTKMEILGRKDALLGVLSNLTDNALQHGATRINITLTAGEQIHFRFADNGQGIPAEIHSEIFKPFFTTRSGGTGLGLAVVQNLVLSHQGEIHHIEGESGGAVFDLSFPAATSQGQFDLPPHLTACVCETSANQPRRLS